LKRAEMRDWVDVSASARRWGLRLDLYVSAVQGKI
jgi:hypothetical protein